METSKNHINKGTQFVNMDGNLITNQQSICKHFQ